MKPLRICIVSATRAEYGLLRPLIHKMSKDSDFGIAVAVTGMHLAAEFGSTYQEIEKDGIPIDKKIEILVSGDTPAAVSKSMGLALMGFADYFKDCSFDAVLILGDRYEMMAVACAAMNARIPIFHIHGGETTEGAVDEAIRHSLTKMSYLHFTSTQEYAKRVIQLGENPDRVFCVGALGVENVLKAPLLSKDELSASLGIDVNCPYAVVTFHPVTLEELDSVKEIDQLLKAMDYFPELQFIVTKANADAGGRNINQILDQYAANHDNVSVFFSLGSIRYLSAVKYCKMVIGNSSSGIIEAPSLGIPTINIGSRQKGRVQADSVLNCQPVCADIVKSMNIALSDSFNKKIKHIKNPYGLGETSDNIIRIIKDTFTSGNIKLMKTFYDIGY